MVRDGFKVLDSDMHVLEPPDLWQRYIDPEFKSQAPVGKTDKIADLQMVGPDGKVWGRTQEVYRDTYQRRGSTDFVKNEDRYRPFEEKGWTPEVQLDGMAQEGIDVAVLYPSRGLFALTVPDLEPRLAAAIARAYNNWLSDFCQKDPARLLGAGMISPFDVNDAVSETQRCVNELGFKAVFLRPNLVNDRNWYDPYYEPCGMPSRSCGSRWDSTRAPARRCPSSGSNSEKTGCCGTPSATRRSRCSPWPASLAEASWSVTPT